MRGCSWWLPLCVMFEYLLNRLCGFRAILNFILSLFLSATHFTEVNWLRYFLIQLYVRPCLLNGFSGHKALNMMSIICRCELSPLSPPAPPTQEVMVFAEVRQRLKASAITQIHTSPCIHAENPLYNSALRKNKICADRRAILHFFIIQQYLRMWQLYDWIGWILGWLKIKIGKQKYCLHMCF